MFELPEELRIVTNGSVYSNDFESILQLLLEFGHDLGFKKCELGQDKCNPLDCSSEMARPKL
jgi:hypothetical protein